MDSELKQYLVEMEERIVAYVNERSEQVETKPLTEFHRWASPAEARNRAIATALRRSILRWKPWLNGQERSKAANLNSLLAGVQLPMRVHFPDSAFPASATVIIKTMGSTGETANPRRS